jgi:hypothetical protein
LTDLNQLLGLVQAVYDESDGRAVGRADGRTETKLIAFWGSSSQYSEVTQLLGFIHKMLYFFLSPFLKLCTARSERLVAQTTRFHARFNCLSEMRVIFQQVLLTKKHWKRPRPKRAYMVHEQKLSQTFFKPANRSNYATRLE